MQNIKFKHWMKFHPYLDSVQSDFYYCKLANKLYDTWRFSLIKNSFDDLTRENISLNVAAYFEDVVSEIGLWRSFTRNNKERYGKYLPFYFINEDDYYTDEINIQDIQFIIWSVLQRDSIEETLLNPENPAIADLALRFYDILDKEFEKAPINSDFLDYVRQEEHYTDFFNFKKIASWLYFCSFLLANDTDSIFVAEMDALLERDLGLNYSQLSYLVRSNILFNQKTGPLALPMKEWFANWLLELDMEEEAAIVSAIESHSAKIWSVNSSDEKYFYLSDNQNNTYPVLHSSLEENTVSKGILVASIVKFDGEWNINGVASWTDSDSFEKQQEEDAKQENQKKGHEIFMKETNGHPLAYFKDIKELSNWLEKIFGLEDGSVADFSPLEGETDLVVFSEPEKELFIMPDLAYCIKEERNPFYDQEKAPGAAISLLTGNNQGTSSVVRFLIENNMLPDAAMNSLKGNKRGLELVQDNIDFIARFFWLERY